VRKKEEANWKREHGWWGKGSALMFPQTCGDKASQEFKSVRSNALRTESD
jgi:hypothetical protein